MVSKLKGNSEQPHEARQWIMRIDSSWIKKSKEEPTLFRQKFPDSVLLLMKKTDMISA